MQPRFIIITSFILSILLSLPASAAVIRTVRGATVIIDMEEIEAKPGQKFYAIDSEGKKKALLEIIKTKDTRALAKILKGSAQIGYEITEVQAGPSNVKLEGATGGLPISAGILLGYAMDTMTITIANNSGTTTGSNINYAGFAQYSMSPKFDIRAVLGFKNFVTKKDASSVDIKFITGELWAKYNFTQGKNKVWVGGGAGILLPTTTSSNVIANDSISTTSNVFLGVGDDFEMSKKMYITAYFDYRKLLFSGSEVDANSIEMNAGLGFKF